MGGGSGGGLLGGVFHGVDQLTGLDLGGEEASRNASNAADRQIAAGQDANRTQRYMFDQQQKNMQPFLQAGTAGVQQLQSAMPDLTRQFTMNDFHQSPGYQFQLDQGINAVQRSAAAKGFLDSTGTMQNINNYAQGAASTEYQQALNNFTNNQTQRYNMLQGLTGVGMGSAQQLAQGGQNYANQYGANMSAMGNASAAAAMNQPSAMQGLMNVANLAQAGKAAFSDRRLKTNIIKLAVKLFKDAPTYLFKYIDQNIAQGWQVGVMAQDLLELDPKHPAVVSTPYGYKVNYSMLKF